VGIARVPTLWAWVNVGRVGVRIILGVQFSGAADRGWCRWCGSGERPKSQSKNAMGEISED